MKMTTNRLNGLDMKVAAIRLVKSFGYAIQGIVAATRDQLNIKIHLLAIFVVIIAGCYYNITIQEWCIVVLCFGMVLTAELINSAIETIVDLVSPGHHPLAGRAKDIAAGAVLVIATATAIVAWLIFKKYITWI